MTTSLALACTATAGPLVAFVIALVVFLRQPVLAKALVLAAGGAALASAITLFLRGPAEPIQFVWFASSAVELKFGFLLDGLSLAFGAVVALIAFLVQVYSLGYMSHDPAQSRFFAMLSLFVWCMLGFVYSTDLLQAFIFWELVGLASFFLIGFWYEKPSAMAAAKKAFIMTRIGDCGLFFGLLLTLHTAHTLDLATLVSASSPLLAPGMEGKRALILALIFLGIMGKSAQFPLHTWLPDAMEGPTPVSALLHSATMVAAGVFLFARLHPLYAATPAVLAGVLAIAGFTALLASTCAMVEPDIKKVLAYSSISQLSYMLLGLAAGSLFAGVFHLITHAFFKALLFLCAGAFIHACDSNELLVIGRRGGRGHKVPFAGLVIGGGALAGVWPLAGFFSKEEILAALGQGGHTMALGAGILGALLTAYYTFRMILLVGRPAAEDHGHHGHAPGVAMAAPIAILVAGTLAIAFAGKGVAALLPKETPQHALVIMVCAIAATATGLALAWWDFGRAGAARVGFLAAMPGLERFFRNGWYLDALYGATVGRLTNAAASALRVVEDHFLDRGFDSFSLSFLTAGSTMARLQTGWIQWYLATTAAMLAGFALVIGLGS